MLDRMRCNCVLFAMLGLLAACGSDQSQASDRSESDVADVAHDGGDAVDVTDDDGDVATGRDGGDAGRDIGRDAGGGEDTGQAGDDIYLGSADPYGRGSLGVATTNIGEGQAGAPVAMQVYEPEEPGRYAVVVFQHGFMMQNTYYSTILEHLASHGFVVVAPQMTGGSFFDAPSAREEADEAKELYDWLEAGLAERISVTPSFEQVGLTGHSRGAKVIWLVMSDDASYADALAGIDPVDGTGGPLGGEERVIDGEFGFSLPVFIMGTGLGPEPVFGQACAPEGDNHEQFYAASPSPAWHVVATEHGHVDMLDDETPDCGEPCDICPSSDDKAAMRELTAGTLVAFFRGALQDDDAAYALLTDADEAPTAVEVEQK